MISMADIEMKAEVTSASEVLYQPKYFRPFRHLATPYF